MLPSSADIKTLFSEGVRHHQAGRLPEAESCYCRILAANPHHGDALHMFGLLAYQTGRIDLSIKLLANAATSDGYNSTYRLNLGFVLEQAGRLPEALSSYDEALQIEPSYAQASCNRGNVLYELGRLEEALASYNEAIKSKFAFGAAHLGRGKVLQQFGMFQDALASYDNVLRTDQSGEIHFYRGNALHSLGHATEALECYDLVLRTDEKHAPAHAAKAAALHSLGNLEKAIHHYDAALRIRPDTAETYFNRGNALQALGKMSEAILSYQSAIRIKPDYQAALLNQAGVLQKLGRLDEALSLYDRVLFREPCSVPALLNRGSALHGLSRYHDAFASYTEALQIEPDCANAHSGCGAALHDLGRVDEALLCYEKALKISLEYFEAHCGRGAVFHEQGHIELALESYTEALKANPDYAEAHMNRGLTLLLAGRHAEGWKEYAWRWRTREFASLPGANARFRILPLWNGDVGAGRTIFLWAEQGLGDTIQFARYIPLVAACGWNVVFETPRKLVGLLSSFNSSRVKVIADGDPIPEADTQCPLLNLPQMFATSTATNPGSVPYLRAEPELRSVWRDRLPSGGLRVGVVWQGSSRHKNDRNRSVSLEQFSALSSIQNIHLISLQKGDGVEQLSTLPRGISILDLGEAYQEGDFRDTAALVAELDLVVAVDTAVAHLAGALGRTVWLALPFVPDWRWGLHGANSYWYPTAKLFRQRTRGDWASVFTDITRELSKESGTRKQIATEARISDYQTASLVWPVTPP